MSFQQELSSWISPSQLDVKDPPKQGDKAPFSQKLPLPVQSGKPTLITFLRHCGCPFAERTFLELRKTASENPSVSCVAVSHSSQDATDRWLEDVGGKGDVKIVVDAEREIYAKWGLGVSGWLHMGPGAFWSVYKLGQEQDIKVRPTESGNRWQTAGSYAVDANGTVQWGGAAGRADEEAKFDEALKAFKDPGSKL